MLVEFVSDWKVEEEGESIYSGQHRFSIRADGLAPTALDREALGTARRYAGGEGNWDMSDVTVSVTRVTP